MSHVGLGTKNRKSAEFSRQLTDQALHREGVWVMIFTILLKIVKFSCHLLHSDLFLRFFLKNLSLVFIMILYNLLLPEKRYPKRFLKKTALEEGVNYSVHAPQKHFLKGHF
jgi:hypothetical protein